MQDKFDDGISDASALTTKTTKTRGKHVDKHCSLCQKTITGGHWSKHVKNVHDGVTLQFERLPKMGNCGEGSNQQKKSEGGTKSCHQGHKMLSCGGCRTQRETRYLRDGLCFGCSKGKAVTVIGAPFLTATMLDRLAGPREEILPSDSLSVVGDKR
ncbi:hypothetical protein FGO68_gene1667 [Halteria grandinella]|uniref:Uncharacterized protein n=1 Tax=Halteria grandinella TaxID=5974 RepID=A0A8J8P7J5_HALGN|nr:hypothetical protein FGO68_gene1667 [Halteria grandinella]